MQPTDKRVPDVEQWQALAGVIDSKTPGALTGSSAPTTATEGKVGQLYLDTTNNKNYVCTAVVEESGEPAEYTWAEVGGAATISTADWNDIFTDPENLNGVGV